MWGFDRRGESLHAAPQTRSLDRRTRYVPVPARVHAERALQPPMRDDVLSVFAGIRAQVRAAGNASTALPQRPCATQRLTIAGISPLVEPFGSLALISKQSVSSHERPYDLVQFNAPERSRPAAAAGVFIKPVTTLLCSVVVLFAVGSPGRSAELKVL